MPKKSTKAEKQKLIKESLLKQKVSTSTGFLRKELKEFIADELLHAANKQKRTVRKNESLQKRYDRFKKYYDKLFTEGLPGNAEYTGAIERAYKKNKDNTDYYIRKKGKDIKVGGPQLAYEMELLAHKLSTQHDVAFTKFKPIYKVKGKGKTDVIIQIPDLKEFDFEEMTTQEILEWFDDNNIEVVLSDPSKIRNKEQREKAEKAKKYRQQRIKKAKETHYKQWKKKKPLKKGPVKKKKK